MNRDFDLALLRAFAAVVETGSITAAARLLNRTQAALSLQIKRLETLLEQPLFVREHRKVILAPAGERLLGPAKRLLALNDDLFDQMTAPAFEGSVKLGVPADIIATYVPPILRRFYARWPRVEVGFVAHNSATAMESLANGTVDLALTTDRDCPRHAETLRVDRLVWAGAPGGDAYRRRPLPLAIGSPNNRFTPVLLDALRAAEIDWRIVIAVAGEQTRNVVAAAGIAVTATLADSVPDGLEVLGPDCGLPELPDFRINLNMPATGGSAIGQELARHIRAEFIRRFGPVDAVNAQRRRTPASQRPST